VKKGTADRGARKYALGKGQARRVYSETEGGESPERGREGNVQWTSSKPAKGEAETQKTTRVKRRKR